ncbi:alpha/beta hydrolase [Marinobacter sp. X15-166B]|nr:alpha/beta hydrolase [Marinobacter sp. X15-166B]
MLEPWAYTVPAGFTLRGYRSPPSGRPLVHFIHGNGYSGLVYEHMLAPLLEHVDLFISDVQGHGDSDHGGRFAGWNRNAHQCVEVLAHYLPDYVDGAGQQVAVYGLGHSFGGVLTALIMGQSPALFSRAVLLDPVMFTPNMIRLMALTSAFGLYQRNTMARRARNRRSSWNDMAKARRNFHNRGIFRGWDERSLDSYLHHGLTRDEDSGELALKCQPEREAEVFATFPRRLWPSLRRVQSPTHIIYGDKTYPFVGQSAQRITRINPRFTSEEVPGGHCFMLERPEETAGRVLGSFGLGPVRD